MRSGLFFSYYISLNTAQIILPYIKIRGEICQGVLATGGAGLCVYTYKGRQWRGIQSRMDSGRGMLLFPSNSCCCLVAKSCLTLQPHGLYSARLLCPWDFPGRNPGVGCHFPLFSTQGSNPLSPAPPALADGFFTTEALSNRCCSAAKSCPPPWTAACQTPLYLPITWSLLKLMSMKEETDRTGSALKAGLHVGLDCGL